MKNTTYTNTEESPSVIGHKELETLTITFINTLKRQKMKCEIDEVLNLFQDSPEENISGGRFDKTLQFLIYNDSVQSYSVSNSVCLSIPKNNAYRDSVWLSLPKDQQERIFQPNIVTSYVDIHKTAVFREINCYKKLVSHEM